MSPDLSDYERATVARIDAAEAAPESYFVRRIVAEELRAAAEWLATVHGEVHAGHKLGARARLVDPPT